ncbi:unnamed protein product [Rotaria socialis]|uniref:Uncharacterized protein n=1 Tax=Rotaria socialis TaxID=392032 RepID=A0A817RTZ8_9BILA|nr:unnamed protein product [Rotaria socialis]CAF3436010.1 unnamed protein product [Rotaria socialis]CAF3459967.1 unnamed protein product [Rotaria socialis]CAF3618258.1 unnamed protein product [Rotaria socialis]CAF3658808.1 unnamed protein product [Rotaria socialis]
MLSCIIILIIYLSINSVLSALNNQTKPINALNIDVNYAENYTIILSYNLTTNYSYFITFRSFGHRQIKYGLFLPTNRSEENSIEIFYQYHTTELFIVCFHFILPANGLDIKCEDLRVVNGDQINSNGEKEFLPSYNPLFVPMMYALSILMLLPVIIQHHRQKKTELLRRQKHLRHLSVSLVQDDPNLTKNILSGMVKNGRVNYENIPIDIELLSLPSTRTMLDDLDDDTNATFTIRKHNSFIEKYDDYDIDRQTDVDAHDCIAHLLDSTPWTTLDINEPLSTSSCKHPVIRDSAIAIKEQHVPTIVHFRNDNDCSRKLTVESNKYSSLNVSLINPMFFESDV